MRKIDARAVAGCRVVVQRKGLTDCQVLPAVGEFPYPELRPLQVGQDADRSADSLLDRADAPDQRTHGFVVGMAHIDAEDVSARLEEFLQHFLAGGGWADRSEDLDLAAASHGGFCPVTAAAPSVVAGSSVS